MDTRVKTLIQSLLFLSLLVINSCGGATPTPVPTEEEATETADCAFNAIASAWVDQNRDGKRDSGDTPLENVEFQIDDPLNGLEDVNEPAISDGTGTAKLYVWLPGCPETGFEIHAKPPTGYQVVTDELIKTDEEPYRDRRTFNFGFTLIEGYPSPTPHVQAFVCNKYLESADDFAIDSQRNVWLVNAVDVKRFDKANNTWNLFYQTSDDLWRKQIAVSQNGVVWINDEFFEEVERIESENPASYPVQNELIAQSHSSIGTSPDGFVWFYEKNEGILSGFNPELNTWKTFYDQRGIPLMPTWIFTDHDTWRATFIEPTITTPTPMPDEWEFYRKSAFSKIEQIENPLNPTGAKAVVDWQGRIWLANGSGVSQYDSQSNLWKMFKPDKFISEYFWQFLVTDVTTATDGSVWFAVKHDHPLILRFVPRTSDSGEWHYYDFRDGIPDISDVTAIEFDSEGNLWVGYGDRQPVARCRPN